REGYAGCCEALAEWDASPHLDRIAAPTLVISGADDSVAPPDRGREIADGIAGSRFVILDDCAHLSSVGQPEAFSAAVLEHLSAPGSRTRA
ncbi:MAG: 3-oxoadipate enol-lactonase, partial [Gaiellales bacterium]